MKVRLWLGDAIYGINDGLAAIFGIIAGVAGFTANHHMILLSGWFGALASTLSMAAGAWLAARSENELSARDTSVLHARVKQNMQAEIDRLTAHYEQLGFTPEEAAWITKRLAEQPERLQQVISRQEGVHSENDRSPVHSFLVAGASTLVGACIPMLPLMIFTPALAFIAAAVVSVLAHFAVGAVKSLVTMRSWWYSGLEMMAVGVVVGVASYGLGLLTSRIV